MLDHGLEITAYALKLRPSHLLPAGATPEAQAAQAEACTAGTAHAALLHDVGKVAVDLHVEHADGSVWHPWHGPLQRPYRFRYRPGREYRLHSAATGLLYRQVLDQQILDWLVGYPDLWAALLDLLGDTAPPTASEIPSCPVAEHEPAPSTVPPPQMSDRAEPSGAHFMAWLRQGIQTRKLIINDAKALVHTVAGTTYLVSPGVFQRYAQEYLQVAALAKQEKLEGWPWVQKRFEKLGQHRKQPSGLSIWTCEVTGPRKSRRLHGYLLASPDALLQEPPPDNPYLRLLNESVKREDSALGGKDNDDQGRHGAAALATPTRGGVHSLSFTAVLTAMTSLSRLLAVTPSSAECPRSIERGCSSAW